VSDRHQEFLLRLRTVGDDKLAVHDLRKLLKALIRGYPRLRCVEAVELPGGGAEAIPTGEGADDEARRQGGQER